MSFSSTFPLVSVEGLGVWTGFSSSIASSTFFFTSKAWTGFVLLLLSFFAIKGSFIITIWRTIFPSFEIASSNSGTFSDSIWNSMVPTNPDALFSMGYAKLLAIGFDWLKIVPSLLWTADSISLALAVASSDVISGEIIYVSSYVFILDC